MKEATPRSTDIKAAACRTPESRQTRIILTTAVGLHGSTRFYWHGRDPSKTMGKQDLYDKPAVPD